MWIIILITVLSVLILGYIWLSFAISRFGTIRRKLPTKRWKRGLCGAGIMALVMLMTYLAFDFVNMVIIMLHLLIIWLLCDGVAFIIKRCRKIGFRHYYAGISAFALTTIWLGIGWYNAHHIYRTAYQISTSKPLGMQKLRIVGLSDSHVGATFHWQEFEEYIDQINKENPDIVVIMGDFIDDDTSKEDMENSCRALSKLKTEYGVYFVYGNHDEGYWNNSYRGYSIEDLNRHLLANGVRILNDEIVPINEHIYVCGRLDKQRSQNRLSASTLMQGRGQDDYTICLDHEPNDYKAETDSKMDLVISGHTHGGQFLGLGSFGVAIGANDAYYGHERHIDTDFIVSSGIGDWAIKFKTGCISEYVVIDIEKQ